LRDYRRRRGAQIAETDHAETAMNVVVSPTVAHDPALGNRESARVAGAQVVGVGISLSGEIVEPHLGLAVLVRQCDGGPLGAARS
jgi:hypothetical protein